MFPIFQYLLKGNFLGAIAYVLSAGVIIFLLLPVHEYAHARTAYALGDPTAKYMGRLSINPMNHIDWIGAAMIMLVGFGWAKPVPIDVRNFRKPKQGMAITALAGPVSNLCMAFLSAMLMHLVARIGITTGALTAVTATIYYNPKTLISNIIMLVYNFFYFLTSINIGLAVFNLIPVPPLDGSRLLTALLPDRIYYKIMAYERYIMFGLMFLLVFGVFSTPLGYVSSFVMNGFNAFWRLIFGV